MHTWRCIALSLDLTLFLLKDGWNYILKHWNSLKIDKQIVNNLLYWGKIKFCAKAVKGLSIDYQKKKMHILSNMNNFLAMTSHYRCGVNILTISISKEHYILQNISLEFWSLKAMWFADYEQFQDIFLFQMIFSHFFVGLTNLGSYSSPYHKMC